MRRKNSLALRAFWQGLAMFNIGMPELIIILIVALLVIGPKKLPDLARSLGKGFREFKKATSDLQESLHVNDLQDVDVGEPAFSSEKEEKPEPPPSGPGDSTKAAEGVPLEATPESGPSGKEVMAESEKVERPGHGG